MLASKNFIENADKIKVIESLKALQKNRELKLYKERPEVMDAIEAVACSHQELAALPKLSYVSSLIHCVAKMRVDDEIVWSSLASFLV